MEIIKKTIGEIASLIKTGKTPPSKEERYYNGNINWYTPGDLDKEKFLGRSNRTITEEAVAENKATILPKYTVVIGGIGDIGKLGITSIESCTNQQITGIRTNEEVYFEYFYYWLKANKPLLKSNAKNAILPILNNESMRAIKIQFPKDIDDQKRIAKVLSQCEELIKKRKESIDLLDKLLKSTFLEMFGNPMRNEKGWAIKKFKDVAKNENFKRSPLKQSDRDKIEGIYPYYGATGIIDFIDDYKFDGAYLLIAEDGKNLLFRKKNNAFMAVGKFWVNNHAHVLSYNGINNLRYLEFFLNNIDFKPYISGIDQVKLNKESLEKISVPQPPLEMQNQFAEIVDQTESAKTQLLQNLQLLENLYGSISQRAFKGELTLRKVDISDMKDFKKKDNEEVKEDITGDNEETLKNNTELTEIIENKKENDFYISKNGLLYIEKSRTLRSKIYLLTKERVINEFDFRDDLMEINKIGEQLHSEIKEFKPWQIDQHKSVERYIALLPKSILDEYPYINVFASNLFDYNLMSLDEYYGIPEDIIIKYGSIEDKTTDLVFFFKKYFSNKLFTIEDLEKKYNQLVYDRGDWFKYEEMKEFIFKAIEGDDALLTQNFEEVEILDIESGKPQTIKKIMLKVI